MRRRDRNSLPLKVKVQLTQAEVDLLGQIVIQLEAAWEAVDNLVVLTDHSCVEDPGLRRWLERRRRSIRRARKLVYYNGGLFDAARAVPSKED